MKAVTADDTGVLEVPAAGMIDADIRQDLTSAAWLIAAVTAPGLALLALVAV